MKKFNELTEEEKSRADDINRKAIFINALDSTFVPDFHEDYFRKLLQSKLTAVNLTVNYQNWKGLEDVLGNFSALYSKIESNSDSLLLVNSTDDIKEAKREGKVGIIMGFQDGRPMERDLGLLRVFHELGLRVGGLTYQRKNYFADGCGEKTDCGLSKLGIQLVEEMNRLGIVIDLTHTGDASSLEAIEVSKDPVIFSHNCARGVYNHFRNSSDEQLKALAGKGGVNCVGTLSLFLSERGVFEGATLEDTLNHIDYIVDLVGVDHVGVGLDSAPDSRKPEHVKNIMGHYPEFKDTVDEYPFEHRYAIKTISDIQFLTHGLVARGYSEADIEKILGGNLMRVFSNVWKN
ncbi:MAG: dipeptidase [Candidatus Hodarchaeota archaeon]